MNAMLSPEGLIRAGEDPIDLPDSSGIVDRSIIGRLSRCNRLAECPMSPVLPRLILAAGLACSSSLMVSAQELSAQAWLVVSVAGEAVAAQPPATFRFEADGRVSGSTGCNRFMASYTLEGQSLRFSQAAGTRMACPAGLMAQEERFLAALGAVRHVAPAGQGVVILAGEAGELFRLVPLR